MRSYIDVSAAFAECLKRQVTLGARIVAAGEALLRDQSPEEMRQRVLSLTLLRNESRSGNAELTKLRRALDCAKEDAAELLQLRRRGHRF